MSSESIYVSTQIVCKTYKSLTIDFLLRFAVREKISLYFKVNDSGFQVKVPRKIREETPSIIPYHIHIGDYVKLGCNDIKLLYDAESISVGYLPFWEGLCRIMKIESEITDHKEDNSKHILVFKNALFALAPEISKLIQSINDGEEWAINSATLAPNGKSIFVGAFPFPRKPIDWDEWSAREKAELWEAILVTFHISPIGLKAEQIIQHIRTGSDEVSKRMRISIDGAKNGYNYGFFQNKNTQIQTQLSSCNIARLEVDLKNFGSWLTSKNIEIPEQFPRKIKKEVLEPPVETNERKSGLYEDRAFEPDKNEWLNKDIWSVDDFKFLLLNVNPRSYRKDLCIHQGNEADVTREINEALASKILKYEELPPSLAGKWATGMTCFIKAKDAIKWAIGKKAPFPDFPFSEDDLISISDSKCIEIDSCEQTQDSSLYPWGNHTTELLMHLGEAARQWWSTYDPENPLTAPTNEDVEEWLKKRGVANRVASTMAQILRADGLPVGRRPKK